MFDLFSRILKDTVAPPPPLGVYYSGAAGRARWGGGARAPGHPGAAAGVEYTMPGRPARAPGHPDAAAGVEYTMPGRPARAPGPPGAAAGVECTIELVT